LYETACLKIVLASDDEGLTDSLVESGIDVYSTSDGFDAIRLAIENRPDAIILGQTANGLPAPIVSLWLRLNPVTHSIPLIGLGDGEFSWQDSAIDTEVDTRSGTEKIIETARKLVSSHSGIELPENMPNIEYDPLTVTLDLLKIYRERLGLAGAMIELASLQHDLGDFEYTVKSILEAAGRALGSPLVSITLIREKTYYALVRGLNVTKELIHEMERHSIEKLSDYRNRVPVIDEQLIIGRRKLAESPEAAEGGNMAIYGHPIYSRGEILGYLAAAGEGNGNPAMSHGGLLPDLTSQVSLLLVNADLVSAQDNYVGELSAILRAAAETSSISPLSDTSSKSFLLQFLLIVLDLCRTNRGCVMTFDTEGENRGIQEVAALGADENEVLASSMDDGRSVVTAIPEMKNGDVVLDEVEMSDKKLTRMVLPLTAGENVMGGIVILGLLKNISPRIVEAVKTLASLAGNFIYNRKLHKKSIQTSIMEDQLNLAREIQDEMLPDGHPSFPGYDIYGRSIAAKEVGGDFFDYLYRNNQLSIAIGDVCGKSIPASLLMTMTRALVHACNENETAPNDVLRTVNTLLTRMIAKGKFVTGSLLRMGMDSNEYASAGHQPLMVYRSESDSFEDIDADGIALGIVDQMDFELVRFSMEPGDIAVMYTDGLNEAMNPDRKQFGYDNIRAIVRKNAHKSSEEILEALYHAIDIHAEGAAQFDDTTTVVIKKIKEGTESNGNNEDNQ